MPQRQHEFPLHSRLSKVSKVVLDVQLANGPLSVDMVAWVLRGTLGALSYLHSQVNFCPLIRQTPGCRNHGAVACLDAKTMVPWHRWQQQAVGMCIRPKDRTFSDRRHACTGT